MSDRINIYCDESCHLENDGQGVMVIGAVWCSQEKVKEATERLREIKERHKLPRDFEIKWSKVSPAKQEFYRDALDYFFDDDDLHFRVVIVPEKKRLNHAAFSQDHDTFYYKLFFQLLKVLLRPDANFFIYLDIKDTRSARKVNKLKEVLRDSNTQFPRNIIERIQNVRSHEVGLIQMADLLLGAVSFATRNLDNATEHPEASQTKSALVGRIRERSGYDLTQSTLPTERKFNIFRWTAQEVSP